ncbi:MAG: CPBP family glutamic-type intramembrane protease [Dehalococcoidia bacterium]
MTTSGEATEQQGEPWRGHWRDYYALLGIARGASPDIVRRAYEERARQIDPASYADAPPDVRRRADEEFESLMQAYRVLGDAALRRLYDEEFDRLSAFRGSGPSPAEGLAQPQVVEHQPWQGSAVAPFDASVAVPSGITRSDVLSGRGWGLRDVLIGFGLSGLSLIVIGSLFVGGAIAFTGEEEGTSIIAAGVIGTIVFDVVLVGLVYLIIVRRYHFTWESFGFRPPGRFWWLPPVAALGVFVVNGIYSVAMRAMGLEWLAPDQELDDLFDTRVLLPLIGFFTLITAPIAEEIFFRGFIFPGLIGRLGVWGAALASGLFFGAVHITSVDTLGLVIPLGGIGVFLALLYARTGSLWVSIGTHFLINAVAFTALVASGGSG